MVIALDTNTVFKEVALLLKRYSLEPNRFVLTFPDDEHGREVVSYLSLQKGAPSYITGNYFDSGAEQWFNFLKAEYAEHGNFRGENNTRIDLHTPDPGVTVENLESLGGYNPLVDDPEEWYLRWDVFGAGNPSVGIPIDFDDLEEEDGVKQMTHSKWVDTVHYYGTGNETLQLPTAEEIVRLERSHRNIFIHNSSSTGRLDVIDHLGEKVVRVPAEHSCDVRITREKEGRHNSIVVSRKPTHHLEYSDSRSPERRWHEAINWATRNTDDLREHSGYDPKVNIEAIRKNYAGYIFNMLAQAHNPTNRASDSRWTTIENNLIDWEEFSRNADGTAMAQRLSGDQALIRLYGTTRVWNWDADDGDIEARVPSETDDSIPELPLSSSFMAVKNVLGYVQDAGVSDAGISEITAVQFDDSEATAIVANPTTYNLIVSSGTINPVITVTPSYEHATVELTAPDTLNDDGSLPTGVHAWTVSVTSQDGTTAKEYTLNIQRSPV